MSTMGVQSRRTVAGAASALLLAMLTACVSPCQTGQDPARGVEPGAPPRTLALLVGINRYAQPRIGTVPTLAGSENDVARAREVLIERFGFTPADILTLTSEAATHAGIVRAFHDHLIARAGKGTKVVFWFSGHGSRTLDLSGIESSKTEDIGDGSFDNTLIAYDSRAQDFTGAYDLADDELHSLLRALVAHTDQVLVVTDCCHSTGAVRGGDGRPEPGIRRVEDGKRGGDADALAPFWPRGVRLLDDDQGDDSERLPYVHIAACAEHQEAGEIKVGDQSFGTLSWFLTEALDGLEPGTSWRALVERVRTRVAGGGNRPDQSVSAAGEVDRPVFGNDTTPPLPGFRVDRAGKRLGIAAGRVHGIAEGAMFDVVALTDRTRCGRARAIAVTPASCTAEWSEGGDHPGEVLRALPDAKTLRMAPLRVHVDTGVDPLLLRDVPWAVACADETAELRLRREGPGLVLCDHQGRRLRPVPTEAAAATEVLFREYNFRGLWESVGQPGTLPLALAVEAADEKAREIGAKKGLPLATVQPLPNGSNGARVLAEPLAPKTGGSLVTLRVTNKSTRALRVTILSVSEDRAIYQVGSKETDRVLRPGDSVTTTVVVGPALDWKEPRPMVDRYLAIATVEPVDFTPFMSEAPVWSPSRGDSPAEPPFLGAVLRGATTRGSGAADEFGLAFCDLHLVPAPPVRGSERPK